MFILSVHSSIYVFINRSTNSSIDQFIHPLFQSIYTSTATLTIKIDWFIKLIHVIQVIYTKVNITLYWLLMYYEIDSYVAI